MPQKKVAICLDISAEACENIGMTMRMITILLADREVLAYDTTYGEAIDIMNAHREGPTPALHYTMTNEWEIS